ncbi:DUF1583 domain-containing protein [Roseiconus nitratireducens]|nr:DUF1583 domain-containing protein [Roseiconus nitratireducens]
MVGLALWLGCFAFQSAALADNLVSQPSDKAALCVLFGDDCLSNPLALSRRMQGIKDADRYTILRDAVFPPGQAHIRLDFDFSPAYVDDQTAAEFGISDPWAAFRTTYDSGVPRGGNLVAPAMILVSAADDLGRLDELDSLVDSRENADPAITLAMRALIAMARRDLDSAHKWMLRLDKQVGVLTDRDDHIACVTVVLWASASKIELRDQAAEFAFRFFEQVRNGDGLRSERWRRHLFAMTYLLQYLVEVDSSDAPPQFGSLAHWHAVSRQTAETNGQGMPVAMWDCYSGVVRNLTGHDRDYLYFDVPLEGDFSIQADVSPFGYGDTRLGFGGIWAGPGFDHRSILNGTFGQDRPNIVLDRPLDEIGESMRVRIIIQDGVRTTLINGRKVFEDRVSAGDPWLSIFSYWYTHGWVRNLRVEGNPSIPNRIDLATSPELAGWNAYFGESVGGEDGSWRLVQGASSQISSKDSDPESVPGELRGQRIFGQDGTFQERWLRYHRPLLEDGTLSYQFFYRPGQAGVHPVIGRQAFLIEPSGVSIHRMTDGKYDRTDLRPSNAKPVENVDGFAGPFALKPDAWNDVQIIIAGDRMAISLNGNPVTQTELPDGTDRTFGLFHYADQTEARVKTLRWQGEWRKTLPPAREQELADDAVEQRLAGSRMEKMFFHDFSDGLPVTRFLVSGEGWQKNFQQLDDGVRLVREGTGGYLDHTVRPHLQLEGDFDVIASFRGFDATTESGGDANVQLYVGFEEQATDCRLYRKFSRFEAKELGRDIVQAAYFYSREGERKYTFPKMVSEAVSAGKLRLSRRGDQMHYLFAANDSDDYRLLHTEKVPTGPTKPLGLGLVTEAIKVGSASVVWKSLEIHAQGMTGMAAQRQVSVTDLDRMRNTLAKKLELDFSDPEPLQSFQTWGNQAEFQRTPGGLRVRAPGFKEWQGHGLIANFGFAGDFDVAMEIDVQKLPSPAQSGECVVLLQAEFDDPQATAVETKYAISDQGIRAAELQIGHTPEGVPRKYEELASIPSPRAHTLRIARRGGTAYFLFQETADAAPRLLGQLEVAETPIAAGKLRAILHASGEGREVIVVIKKLTIHADEI